MRFFLTLFSSYFKYDISKWSVVGLAVRPNTPITQPAFLVLRQHRPAAGKDEAIGDINFAPGATTHARHVLAAT